MFYLRLSSVLASPSTYEWPFFLSVWQEQELKWTGSHCAWYYNVMPSWWHDLIRVTRETLETAHHSATGTWAARGRGSKLFIQSQETQSYKETTGRKLLQTPIYNIITLTYSRNTPRSNKQQKEDHSSSAIASQFYTPSVNRITAFTVEQKFILQILCAVASFA